MEFWAGASTTTKASAKGGSFDGRRSPWIAGRIWARNAPMKSAAQIEATHPFASAGRKGRKRDSLDIFLAIEISTPKSANSIGNRIVS